MQRDIARAYLSKDDIELKQASAVFLKLAADMDALLAMRSEFLLGNWLVDAKEWAATDAERRQYERNARLQITVWGPSAPDAMLFDYANKQWSGLIRGYYIPRWKQFLDYLAAQLSEKKRFSETHLIRQYERPADQANEFYKKLSQWERAWVQ